MRAGYFDGSVNGTYDEGPGESYPDQSYEDAYAEADFDYLYEIGTDEQVGGLAQW